MLLHYQSSAKCKSRNVEENVMKIALVLAIFKLSEIIKSLASQQ
jgi:hypothetical protein